MSGFFTWSKKDVYSALTSLVITVLIAVGVYITNVGSIWKIDWKTLVDIGIMAGIVAVVSILKSLLTTKEGKFAGLVKIK